MPQSVFDPVPQVSSDLSIPRTGVQAVIELLRAGNTVPFIARYRKEATGELDEVQIRAIQERSDYLIEFDERRRTILESIDKQGKLTDALRAQIEAAPTKAALEDLYLPYKPKRRTRATIARERGLQPLADRILAQPATGSPIQEASAFVDAQKEVEDAAAALAGARDIAAEHLSEDATIRAMVRTTLVSDGQLISELTRADRDPGRKYQQYYEHREPVSGIPSHRFLAIRRGEREQVLKLRIEIDEERLLMRMLHQLNHRPDSPFGEQLQQAAQDGYRRLLHPSVENELRVDLKLRSDQSAVEVFANNLHNLLMAAPLGERSVIGVDPGLRTGCKCVALDATGRFLEQTVIFLARGESERARAQQQLQTFIAGHRPAALAIGNGTGGRETEAFVRQVLSDMGDTQTLVVQVNEAGASVYSASDTARAEFPDLDLTVRGAISIGRRLQDPLAELVKIDPKAIGVGQYQHDVHQPLLARKLDEVVESCVNRVGVELNTASAALLSRVAGIGEVTARKIVAHRDQNGPFARRQDLLQVSGLGPRTFEQAAGFLRVRGSAQPLDASAVHPERYPLVEKMAADLKLPLESLIGNSQAIARVDISAYCDDSIGEPTLRDILGELLKPGRDPRSDFEPIRFRDDIHCIQDLTVGMHLQGVVTNVTHFGAFVDLGVHRDGLVHISELSDSFVSDPHQVVRVGQRLQVRVIEVDVERDRISLSAKSPDAKPTRTQKTDGAPSKSRQEPARDRKPARADARPAGSGSNDLTHNPFANLFKSR